MASVPVPLLRLLLTFAFAPVPCKGNRIRPGVDHLSPPFGFQPEVVGGEGLTRVTMELKRDLKPARGGREEQLSAGFRFGVVSRRVGSHIATEFVCSNGRGGEGARQFPSNPRLTISSKAQGAGSACLPRPNGPQRGPRHHRLNAAFEPFLRGGALGDCWGGTGKADRLELIFSNKEHIFPTRACVSSGLWTRANQSSQFSQSKERKPETQWRCSQ
ncbi:hypothetical protein BDK51DRAFT_30172 [Blyttiomyces helicus]|uniref:Uncharacterized protein n=1 Tax=Blyttiomyces helicus TaxID=388810 RepID=A0A4P9WMN4_9FUNG|nr:hypothetical protein BDK51DRAFT_30172 [Blyttiomyces helicus]|eukprot:RKO93752.1 hypothetical protein BDK51DRAFT_30172 [Blyttiomyces helicus]